MGCIYFPFKIKIALLSPTGKMYWMMFSGELRREHEVYEKRRPIEQRGGERKIQSVKCRKSGTSNFLFGNNFNLTEKVTRLA